MVYFFKLIELYNRLSIQNQFLIFAIAFFTHLLLINIHIIFFICTHIYLLMFFGILLATTKNLYLKELEKRKRSTL